MIAAILAAVALPCGWCAGLHALAGRAFSKAIAIDSAPYGVVGLPPTSGQKVQLPGTALREHDYDFATCDFWPLCRLIGALLIIALAAWLLARPVL